jgi:hypothetical protein
LELSGAASISAAAYIADEDGLGRVSSRDSAHTRQMRSPSEWGVQKARRQKLAHDDRDQAHSIVASQDLKLASVILHCQSPIANEFPSEMPSKTPVDKIGDSYVASTTSPGRPGCRATPFVGDIPTTHLEALADAPLGLDAWGRW